jgi:hypothetical protein
MPAALEGSLADPAAMEAAPELHLQRHRLRDGVKVFQQASPGAWRSRCHRLVC